MHQVERAKRVGGTLRRSPRRKASCSLAVSYFRIPSGAVQLHVRGAGGGKGASLPGTGRSLLTNVANIVPASPTDGSFPPSRAA